MPEKTFITVEATVNAPVDKVWKYWTEPEHITQWNNASEDWHTPHAIADLKEGGKFTSRMEAKDGSAGFNFEGIFTRIEPLKELQYTIVDGRTVAITFEDRSGATHIIETFEAENVNPVEMQKQGWQAILDNFKKYTESH